MEANFEEVWSRVTSGGDDGLTELRRRIRREAEIRMHCDSQLRRSIGPTARETLYMVEKRAAVRLRQLQALHFLISGSVWKPPVSPAQITELPQVLREIYRLLSDGSSVTGNAGAGIGPRHIGADIHIAPGHIVFGDIAVG